MLRRAWLVLPIFDCRLKAEEIPRALFQSPISNRQSAMKSVAAILHRHNMAT
jgi:hypothetical protein